MSKGKRRVRGAADPAPRSGPAPASKTGERPQSAANVRAGLPLWLRWLRTAALAIAAGVVPFLLLEVGLRAFHYGYPTAFFVPIEGKKASASNEKFGWRFFPPSIARIPVVSYVPDEKGPETYRIFILGDSAAMGVPEPAFGFARMLGVLLENRYRGAKFEVVNTAMTAINSHVMVPIAADSARAKPDLFVILVGNNEVVGPYGPGTVLAAYSPSLSLIRAGIWFKSTRTAQLLEKLISRFRKPDNPREWEGMAMFLGHYVAEDDPRLRTVYENFRGNLAEVCRIARKAGASVILSTVPVNLKDNAPFVSVHRSDLSADNKSRWQRLYDEAVQKAKSGRCLDAVDEFREAARLDDGFADLHYRLARCLLALQKPGEAKEHFVRALDLDALRFRADTRINQSIREVAAAAGPGVQLGDIERAFAEATGVEAGVAGEQLFYEHVHLNFAGNYLLANTLLPRVEAVLPERIRKRKEDGPALSASQVAEALVFTDWEQDRSAMEMLGMMLQPPFTAQADFGERRTLIEGKLAALRQKWAAPGKFETMRQDYARYIAALRRDPDDLDTREILAELLSKSGDSAGAAEQYRALIGRVPDVARWRAGLAHELAETGRLAEARSEAASALRLDPQIAAAHFTIGFVLEHSGQPAEGMAEYETVLRMKPDYAEAYLRLGVILSRQGRYREAVDHYAEFLRLAPGSAEVENNMGVLLGRLGDIQSAVAHYREALRFRPDFAEACNNLGAALERLGEVAEAIGYYQQALRLRPDFPEARQHLNAALARSR
jgi:tetratricopeptide (TPR) repeat protein